MKKKSLFRYVLPHANMKYATSIPCIFIYLHNYNYFLLKMSQIRFKPFW